MNESPTRDPAVLEPIGEAHLLACRCEEILLEEIVAAVIAGARSVDDVKRRTRAGMGICQGIYCSPTIAAIVAEATGSSIGRIAPMTARPPTRMVALEALAAMEPDGTLRTNSSARDRSDWAI